MNFYKHQPGVKPQTENFKFMTYNLIPSVIIVINNYLLCGPIFLQSNKTVYTE